MFKLGARRTIRRRNVVAIVAAAALLAGAAPAVAQVASNQQSGLLVSSKATRAGAEPLSGNRLSGPVYIFFKSEAAISSVRFFLNDPTGVKEPLTVDEEAPFDLGGRETGAPRPLDTTKLKNGRHTLLAEVTTAAGGKADRFARFTVRNSGGGTTTTPTADKDATPTRTGGNAGAADDAGGAGAGTAGGATPTRAANKGPVITKPIWKSDFDKGLGAFKSTPWNNTEKGAPIAKTGPLAGRAAAASFVLPQGVQRNEVEPDVPNVSAGDDMWYAWSNYFPQDFKNPNGGWFLIIQWHSGGGSPPLGINISNDGNIHIGGDGTQGQPNPVIGPVRKGVWTDYVLHVKFGQGGDAYVEAWENGVQKVKRTNRGSMSSGSNYLKMGIYRDPGDPSDFTVGFADMVIGTR